MKTALITGVTGQDGSYLAETLIEKGYAVHGLVRRSSSFNTGRIDHLHQHQSHEGGSLGLHYADLSDASSLFKVIQRIKPDEIYNLGAQSHVGISFDTPDYTADATGVSAVKLLEAVRAVDPAIKVYQASSSELYGQVVETPQKETTPFYPRSPYACAKLYAFWIMKNYRESYGMFICNGILFNHESERRGRNFVTRKITRSLAEIALGQRDVLQLGNLDAKRDWGHARDYVEAMWLMMQYDVPDDYVVATGETHSVREFAETAAKHVGIELAWEGAGQNEKGVNSATGETIIEVNPKYYRPAEVDLLLGDASKAMSTLGWAPKIGFKDLAKLMMEEDLRMVREKDERY